MSATKAPTLRKLPERITLTGNFPKEAFDEVEPGRGGWRKMQMKAGMALKPGDDLGMFVGRHDASQFAVLFGSDLDRTSGRHNPTMPEYASVIILLMTLH
jgi:hypothetical protein